MEESHRSSVQWNKHCKPPPEPSRIPLACILCDGNLPELWGIYEWRAIPQDQPNRDRVVFVGCICCGHYEPLRSRIIGHCSLGNHRVAVINDALTKGYTLEVRYKQAGNDVWLRLEWEAQWRKTWYKTIANLIRGHIVYEDIRDQLKAVRK